MATNTYSAEVLINSAKASRSLNETRQSADQLNKSLSTLFTTIKGGQGDLNSMAKSIGSLSATVAEAKKASQELADAKIAESKAVSQANKAIDSTNINNASTASRGLAKGIDETASASARLRQSSPASTFNESAKAANNFGDSLANQRYLLYDIGATYRTLAIAAQAIPAASVAAATAYERDFAQVMRVTGQTTLMSEDLRSELKQLGSEIPLSFSELANIAQIGGQMDVPAEQLSKFTETVARFVATADGATIDSTTQAFGRMANLFNTDLNGNSIDPEFFNRLGSAISMTADNAVTSEAKIISMLDKMAPVAKQAGLSAKEVTAFASAMSSVGLAPEISSGFFTRFFGNLNKDIASGNDRLKVYANTLGITVDEFTKLYQSNPSAVLQGVAEAMSTMDKVSGTSLLGELGVKATRDQRVLAGLSESYQVLEKAMGDVDEAYAKASYLEASSAGIFGTFASNLQKLGNAIMNLGDSIGAGPLAVINTLTEGLTGFIQTVSTLIDEVPALKSILAVLLNFGSVAGIFFAMKSALAFVTASMVAFQQANRTGVVSSLSLKNATKTLATTMLASRGASEQATNALLKQASGMQALRIAATTTKATIDSLNNAQLASGSTAMVVGAQAQRSWKGVGSAILGMAGGPLGAAIGALGLLGTAWYTASQQAKQGAEEVVRAFAQTDAAGIEALATAFSREKLGLSDTTADIRLMGKSYQELAGIAGVSMGDITRALSGGKEELDAYIASLEEQKRVARDSFGDFGEGSTIAPAIGSIIEKLKGYSNEMQVADDIAQAAKEGQDALGVSVDETGESFDASATEVRDWANELSNAVSQAFGFMDAQGQLAASMEKLGAGLNESGSFSTGDSGGRNNIANLQATLQAQAMVLQQQLAAQEISAQEAANSYSAFATGLLAEIANMGGGVSDEIRQVATDAVAEVETLFGEQAIEVPVTANTAPVEQDVSSVMSWLNDYISEPKSILLAAGGVDETAQQVNSLVQYIADQTGLPFTAVIEALTNPAGENTEQVAKFMQDVVNTDYTAFINADTSAGAQNVHNFAVYAGNQLAEIAAQSAAVAAMVGGPAGMAVGAAFGQLSTAILAMPAQTIAKANNAAVPSFKPLVQGYKDAGNAARGAGNNAKKAGNTGTKAAKKAGDAGAKAAKKAGDAVKAQKKDWDELEQQITGYASRVGTAFGYVTAKQTGVAEAKDEYYSILNGIKERLEQQKQTVKDLRAENKALNAERRVQLNDAAKLEKMAGYADQMGNTERAKYYRDEAKALKASAAETKSKIDANNKEAVAIEKGIGNLKGYSKEAIENRKEIRSLRDASLAVAEAYAKSGASAKTVANETQNWTNKAKTHSRQLGYTKKDVEGVTGKTNSYVSALKKVPKTVSTKINETKTTTLKSKNQAASGVNAANRELRRVPSSKTSTIKAKGSGITGVNNQLNSASKTRTSTIKAVFDAGTKKRFRALGSIYSATGNFALGSMFTAASYMAKGGLAGRDGMMKFNNGGLVPGTPPGNPKKDNIMATLDGQGIAAIRSGEYIQSQPAVDYYGTTFMDKLNRMEIPRYYLGGSVGRSKSDGGTMPTVIELGSESIQSIARLVQKDIYLYADNLQLAQSVQRGFDELAQRGGIF